MLQFLIEIGIIGLIYLSIVMIIFPFYCYVVTRLLSKAWHKSKNEEAIHHG